MNREIQQFQGCEIATMAPLSSVLCALNPKCIRRIDAASSDRNLTFAVIDAHERGICAE
jgi:hypothetical protein